MKKYRIASQLSFIGLVLIAYLTSGCESEKNLKLVLFDPGRKSVMKGFTEGCAAGG
jgi:hypothetical protein